MGAVNFAVSASLLPDANALVVTVSGELEMPTVDPVRAACEPAISERMLLVLDLKRCEFIDSMGIDLVMRLHRAVSESRGRAALAAVAEHEQVLRMFRLTRIDELIPVFHSRQEAIEWARAQG